MDTYTITEAARLVGTSTGKLYQAIRAGRFQALAGQEPGAVLRVTPEALRAAGFALPPAPRPASPKPRHNFLYTSSELSRLKRWSPPLCGMNEFEKPQLLSGKGELHLAHHRLGAIEHQGFLRIQRDQ